MASPFRGFVSPATTNRLNALRSRSTTSSTHTFSTSSRSLAFECRKSSTKPLHRSRLPHIQIATRTLHTSPSSQSSSRFTYGISASFTAKDRRFIPDRNVFNFNPYNQILARRKDKRTRPDSGQDAFFVSRVAETSDIALGVADGVGGWMDSGVDPADFSHGICDYMAHAAYTHKEGEWNPPIGAKSLMQRGYEEICRDKTVPAGGSTACVAIAKGNGNLEVANLGDSGFVQLRLNAIHNYSEPQTHAFNTPYQLSVVPQKVAKQSAAFGGSQIMDFPKDANVSQHELRHGDVVVFASDGVWDNLAAQDILRIVSKLMLASRAWEHTDGGISIGSGLSSFIMNGEEKGVIDDIPSLQSFLAVGITSEAKAASVNTKRNGPFAREVQRYYPHEGWRGGKVDDICVVVAIACEEGK